MSKRKKEPLSNQTDQFGIPIKESVDLIFEMATLQTSRTGLPYYLHVRTKVEVEKTPHKDATPTLKVYQLRPASDVPWFAMTISDEPHVIGKSKKGGKDFFDSVPGKQLKHISEWIKINEEQLLTFWSEGMYWTNDERKRWEKTLTKSVQRLGREDV